MALFGKKAKDGASDSPLAEGEVVETDAGGVAVMEEVPAPAKKGKAARAPKVAKDTKVKNGVAVGLNIGNQFIKAVEVTSKGGELSVTAMGAVPTPPESYTNGNVLSVSALSGAIRDLWKGAGIKSKVAITSVAGTGALVVRVIEVPKMSDGELGDNMKVDADRYIPFPPSEVVMDFKALRELPTDPDAPNMEVLLAAAQREIIDLHVQVVQKAKLDPRAIDVEPIAAARAMQLERRSDGNNFIDYNEVTALVNLGATGTEISILRGDILVFTRVVPGGGNALTQAIAEGMGLPFSDAERVKIESADAIAPAGYTGGGGSDFGSGGDFNFGDDFSGGDLNSAFEDISANPTAAASDDPFDLDFFNQTPQDEPGAGHAQKEGEPGEDAPSAFNFSDFNFEAPATEAAATPAPDATPASTPSIPAPDAPVSFNFGFDDLSDDDLPTVETPGAPAIVIPVAPSGTAKLEASAAEVTPPTSTVAPDFAAPASPISASPAPMGSAFDFDNFDLPTATPETSTVAPFSPEPAPIAAPISFEPTPAATAPVPAPDPFDFTPSEPAPAPSFEAAPVEISLDKPVADVADAPPAVNAAPSDEFDLDAIFGTSAPANVAVPDADPFADVATPMLIPAATSPAEGDFDLSGIDTGAVEDFGGGFGDSSEFGAGLGASGAGADAAALYGLISPSLEELAGEVRRSLEFHLGRYPDATISRLVLLGGGARLRNLDVFLTQMIGVPTAVANPFAHITVQTPKLAPGYASDNGPLCAVALGLALRDFVD